MTENLNRYPGGKGTFYQRIINIMPPHRFYIETHIGGGAVMRHKRPAEVNVGLDIDPKVKGRWRTVKGVIFYNTDALAYLKGIQKAEDVLIYCDPPYLMETRKAGKMYDYEYDTQDHLNLLALLKELDPCKVIVSGYWSDLYGQELEDWNHLSFEAMTRGGPATEHLWFNYDYPKSLHDYNYLGDNYRDRERIKRKQDRWISRLKTLDILERKAMLTLIKEEFEEDL